MKKYYCDLCGKETTLQYSISAYAGSLSVMDKPEVCEQCLDKFQRTIESFEKSFTTTEVNNNG